MDIINSSFADLPQTAVRKLTDNQLDYFSSYAWYDNFIEAVVKIDELKQYFLTVEVDGEAQLIFPVEYTVKGNGCRQLQSLTNYYSPIYQLIIDKSDNVPKVVLAEFFSVFKARIETWDVMILHPIAEDDVSLLSQALKKAGLPSVSYFAFGNWYLEVKGRSYQMYLADLKSKVRSNINNKTKQFEGLDGAKIVIVCGGDELGAAIKAYEHVYNLSWKVNEPYTFFIPGLIKAAAKVGALRLGIAYLHDQPVAAQIWLVQNSVANIFKVAYDENFKQYAIGTVLTGKLMQYVIDCDKVSEVDYLMGDDSYKKNWMSHRRERFGLIAYNTATFRGNREMLKEMSKRSCKTLLGYGQKLINTLQDKQTVQEKVL